MPRLTFPASDFHFHGETRTFIAEESDLRINRHPDAGHWSRLLFITLLTQDEGDIEFRFEGTDEFDGDISGWRYDERFGNRHLLIIND